MKKKGIIILVIVFAALIAAYLFMNYLNERAARKEQQEAEKQNVQVTDFKADEVTEFSYQYEQETLEFEKQDDQWVCSNEPDTDLDEDAVDSLLDTLGDISTKDQIVDPEDISQYGLDSPTQKALIRLEDGSSIELTFGSENGIAGGYYMQKAGDDSVYLVDSSLVTSTLASGPDGLAAEDTDTDSDPDDSGE